MLLPLNTFRRRHHHPNPNPHHHPHPHLQKAIAFVGLFPSYLTLQRFQEASLCHNPFVVVWTFCSSASLYVMLKRSSLSLAKGAFLHKNLRCDMVGVGSLVGWIAGWLADGLTGLQQQLFSSLVSEKNYTICYQFHETIAYFSFFVKQEDLNMINSQKYNITIERRTRR